MARFMVKTLGAKIGYVLDDSGGYGVGLADAFVAGARATGMTLCAIIVVSLHTPATANAEQP